MHVDHAQPAGVGPGMRSVLVNLKQGITEMTDTLSRERGIIHLFPSVFYWKIHFGPRPRHISIGA